MEEHMTMLEMLTRIRLLCRPDNPSSELALPLPLKSSLHTSAVQYGTV